MGHLTIQLDNYLLQLDNYYYYYLLELTYKQITYQTFGSISLLVSDIISYSISNTMNINDNVLVPMHGPSSMINR